MGVEGTWLNRRTLKRASSRSPRNRRMAMDFPTPVGPIASPSPPTSGQSWRPWMNSRWLELSNIWVAFTLLRNGMPVKP